MSHVSCLMSHVSCLMSHVSRLTSHVSRLMSHVSCLMSHVSLLGCLDAWMLGCSSIACRIALVEVEVWWLGFRSILPTGIGS